MTRTMTVIAVALLLTLLFTGCSKTITVTPPTVTVTSPAVTVTETITKTQTPLTVTVTQTPPPVTITITPTWIPSIYRGSMTITYKGTTRYGTRVNGTCQITIDENGDVTGAFGGQYSGDITGQVESIGNLIAIGTFTGGTTPVGSTWSARIVLSGKSLSVQGKFSGGDVSGTFTGTGTVSY
jgi:hypothetical protein